MKKKIITALIIIILIGMAGYLYYLNKVILPTVAKEKIISALSEITNSKVTLEKIGLNIFKGIVISNLKIADKDNPQEELCSIKEASSIVLILPLIKDKKIIISSLKLDSINIHLTRNKDNSLNISYLIDKFLKKDDSGKNQFSVLIKGIQITNSSIFFTDASFETPTTTTLKINTLSSDISLTKLSLEMTAEISKGKEKTSLQFNAAYAYINNLLKGSITAKDINLMSYKEYLKNIPIALETCKIPELRTDFSLNDKNLESKTLLNIEALNLNQDEFYLKNAKLNASVSIRAPRNDFKKFTIEGTLNLENVDFSTKKIIDAEGKIVNSQCDFSITENIPTLSVKLNLEGLKAKKDAFLITIPEAQANANIKIPDSFEGSAKIKNSEISGIEKIDKISEIFSTINFKNTDLTISDFSAKILDTAFKATGELKQNALTIDATGTFGLAKLSSLIPKEMALPAFEISGTTNLNIHISSDFSKNAPPSFSGDAVLENTTLNLPENNLKFTTDKGNLKFDTQDESLQWHFNSIKYLTKAYNLNGNLKNFKIPEINAMIISDEIKLQTNLIKNEDKINISLLKGQYRNSKFDLKGEIINEEDMTASGTISLFLPDFAEATIDGQLFIDAQISGPIKNYYLWNIKATGNSKLIKAYGIKIENIELDYNQIKQEGFINYLNFNGYNGTGTIKGRVNFLDDKNISYALHNELNNVDLSLLKLDTTLKETTFSGDLSMRISVQGKNNDLNSLKGGGAFTIKNGNIWEFNPLKGLGTFLFISKFNNIVFTNAQGDFYIQDGYVSSDNLELLGTEIGLIAEGKITFKGELDFLVNTQLPQSASESSGITQVISKAGSMTAIKITGTTKEPKYKVQPIAENIIKKLGDIFSNFIP